MLNRENQLKLIESLKKAKEPAFYAAVVPITPSGEVLIGFRDEDKIWTTPAGGSDPGETPEECAVRELWEEAGIAVRPEQLKSLGTKPTKNGKVCHCFWVLVPRSNTSVRQDPDKEVKQWIWSLAGELPETINKDKNRLETINQAFMAFHGIRKSMEDMLKGGKKAEIGEIRQWGKYKFQKQADGWYYVDGPHKGKKMGSAGRAKSKPSEPKSPKKPEQKQEPKAPAKPKSEPSEVKSPKKEPAKAPAPELTDEQKSNRERFKNSFERIKGYQDEIGSMTKNEYIKATKATVLQDYVERGKSQWPDLSDKQIHEIARRSMTRNKVTARAKDRYDAVINNAQKYGLQLDPVMAGELTERGKKEAKKDSPEGRALADSELNQKTNMIKSVDFSKTSKANQATLMRHLNDSNKIIEAMGIKFKTPLHFSCDRLGNNTKRTRAVYQRSRFGKSVILKDKSAANKSVMHEIGHGLDDALRESSGFRSAEINKMEGQLKEDFQALKDIVTDSKYYTEADRSFARYLNDPTEVFARAFEVYSLVKAEELIAKGEVSKDFTEAFVPDIFKQKDETLAELRKEVQVNYDEYMELKGKDDPKAQDALNKYRMAREKSQSRVKELGGSYVNVSEDKQAEYKSKISELMGRILASDAIKKAAEHMNVDLFKGVDIHKMTARMKLRRGGKEALLQYINNLKDRSPELSERIYREVYPESEQAQDTEINKSLNDLLKARTEKRADGYYYVDGPNAGKKVGTVRQPGQGKPDAQPKQAQQEPTGSENASMDRDAQIKEIGARAKEMVNTLKTESFVQGRDTTTGKPMATNLEDARKIGYEISELSEAYNYHIDQAQRIGSFMQKHGLSDPQLDKLKKEHTKIANAFQRERVRRLEREDKMKQTKEPVQKSIVKVSPHESREISTADHAKDREESLKSGWLERLHRSMEGFKYGDLPREIELDQGMLHLVKVDEGLYTGFIKLQKMVQNEETGEMQMMEDTSKTRLERMTLAEIPNFLMAKEFISPIPEPQPVVGEGRYLTPDDLKEYAEPQEPTFADYMEAKMEEMGDQLTDLQETRANPVLDQKIRILELIAKLTA